MLFLTAVAIALVIPFDRFTRLLAWLMLFIAISSLIYIHLIPSYGLMLYPTSSSATAPRITSCNVLFFASGTISA